MTDMIRKFEIDIDKFIQEANIADAVILEKYLKDIYEELREKESMNKLDMYEYMKLPMFISNKIFTLFDKDKDNLLTLEEFKSGFLTISCGSYSEIKNFIFDFCDVNNNDQIYHHDLKYLLFYFSKCYNKHIQDDLVHMEAIITFLNKYFTDRNSGLSRENFFKIVENSDSDLFFILYIFLLKSLPFHYLNLRYYESSKNAKKLSPVIGQYFSNYITQKNTLPVPSKNILIFFDNIVYDIILKNKKECSNLKKEEEFESESEEKEVFWCLDTVRVDPADFDEGCISIDVPIFQPFKNILRESKVNPQKSKRSKKNSENIINLENFVKIYPNSLSFPENYQIQVSGEIKGEELKNNKPLEAELSLKVISNDSGLYNNINLASTMDTPSPGSTKRRKALLSDADILSRISKEDFKETNKFIEITQKNRKVDCEGYLYKYRQRMCKQYVVLIGQEMYFFKDANKKLLKGMRYLKSFRSLVNDESYLINQKNIYSYKTINDMKYIPFSLYIGGKVKEFHTDSDKDYRSWIKALRYVLNVKNINDYYSLNECIYAGKMIKVMKGVTNMTISNKNSDVHHKDKNLVAVKIYPKKAILDGNKECLLSLLNEIDLLKLIKHENVVRFIDFFDDLTNFYLVTEYLERQDLSCYLQNEIINYSGKRNIIHQLCQSVHFLHSLGIMHRDLKPANVGLTKDLSVKIIDFGLSKTITETEVATESYGTILFTAPEILLKKTYNKQIDIWSLGIVIYYVIFETLPFKSEERIKEAFTTNFYKKIFIPFFPEDSMISDLIAQCLEKDASKRISIDCLINKFFS